MIAMVENAKRQKTPNEIALTILLVALTIVFLFATVTLLPFSSYSVAVTHLGTPITITALIALLVLPHSDDHRRAALGHRGRRDESHAARQCDRHFRAGGGSGRRRGVLLLDKTGTITLGNRQAATFIPAPGISEEELARRRPARVARR